MADQPDIYTERWVERPETNGLAIAGFVCSLLGITTLGLLSPIGLVLSLAAMFRPPRGLAIAGFILGLFGSIMFVFILLLVLVVIIALGVAAAAAILGGQIGIGAMIETGLDGWKIREAIVAYHYETGEWPGSVEDLTGLEPGTTLDFWSNPYIIEIDAANRELKIRTIGEDGAPDTDDDFNLEFDLDRN